jgi:DNA-directed RNA polymerase specialized sigma24 family protein
VRRNRDEFTDFYRASWNPCLQAVLASGEDLQSAEDLVAEAFARAWASWPQLRGHPAPRAWVVRTALNTRVSWWRRRWRELPLADPRLALPGDFPDLIDIDLLAAIRRLPIRQRQIIALRILADLDTETTSQQLGIAPGTVRAHLSRAVHTLRQEMLPYDDKKESQCTNTTR